MASDKLDGVHPMLVDAVSMVLRGMAAIGKPMGVAQGLRSDEVQHELWRQGREIPGPNVRPGHPLGDTVTNCDGRNTRSNHQKKSDGYGHAVDCFFLGPDPFGDHQPWAAYGALGEALGLSWGGRWTTRYDRPHLELR